MLLGLDTEIIESNAKTIAEGVLMHIVHPDCSMRLNVENYLSAHSVTTMRDLFETIELYEDHSILFGFAYMLIYPQLAELYTQEAKDKFLELCLLDHLGTQLMKFVFYSGLPDVFYEIPSDVGLHETFVNNFGLLEFQREY